MLYQALRKLGQQVPKMTQQMQLQGAQGRRGFAGHYEKAKVDTSLDHVFGDNSYKLPFNFEPEPMLPLFVRSLIVTGVFFFPIWIFMYDDYQFVGFQEKLAAAKAKQGADS